MAPTSSQHAPVALFAYKRPEHLRRTIAALQVNSEAANTALYVFSDGPRADVDLPAVLEVRDIIRQTDGFASVQVSARDTNAGLSQSIIEGVTRVVREHGRLIVVEDDLVVSPFFLRHMNDALATYADADQVASIHGYVYPVSEALPETFFLKGADCWGWATWDRAWRRFEPDGAKLLTALLERRLTHEFDLDGSYPYTQMLRDQIAGKNDSWAIRWHATAFLAGALTLYPGRSLVQNIGNDASGTHCAATEKISVHLAQDVIDVQRVPLVENVQARAAFCRFLRQEPADTPRWRGFRKRIGEVLQWLR